MKRKLSILLLAAAMATFSGCPPKQPETDAASILLLSSLLSSSWSTGIGTGTGSGTATAAQQTCATATDSGSTASGASLSLNSPTSASISSTTNTDVYSITLVAGQKTLILVSRVGSALDPKLAVCTSSGTVVGSVVDAKLSGNGEAISFTAGSSGTYNIAVAGFSSTTGSYYVEARTTGVTGAASCSNTDYCFDIPSSFAGITSATDCATYLGGSGWTYGASQCPSTNRVRRCTAAYTRLSTTSTTGGFAADNFYSPTYNATTATAQCDTWYSSSTWYILQ